MESASSGSTPAAVPGTLPALGNEPAGAVSYRRETNILRLFCFAVYTIQAVVASYFPLYFLSRGYNASQIGILYSLGPFVSVFANLLMGAASDKYRTLKKILTVILFGQLVMVSLLFHADAFAVVCLVMLLLYFCQMPVYPLTDSLILLSGQTTGTPYSLVRIFGSLGFAAMAFGMGQLLRYTGSSATLIAGLCTIGISLILSFKLKDYQGSLRKIEFSGFLRLFRKKDIVLFFALILVISVSLRMYEGFLTVTLHGMGAGNSLIGFALLTSAVSEIPVFYLLGRYGHKFKEMPLLAIASFVYAIRFFLVSEIDSPIWIIPIQAMHSISFGIYFATALRCLSAIIPDEYRSSGQAVYAVVWTGFAGIISGTAGGAVFEHFGRDNFHLLAAALALVASAGFLLRHLFTR